MIEAESIYVGYKYYESRYYDAVMGQANASSSKGSLDGSSWSYDKNVIYTFGHGLSYIPYTQTLKSVNIDKGENGEITATVEVKNEGAQDGKFLAQLYVQQPYTDYDKTNKVEKSAIMFLNSAKVDVKAGATAEVEITLPSKYLASYDSNGAKTYILDAGNYYFTAAAGAHEAVNNVLKAQGKDVDADGAVITWNERNLDTESFSESHGTKITNQMETTDINYWLPGSVTYLSRSDWEATYPVNYNANPLKVADSAKKDEWVKEMQGRTYEIQSSKEVTNVDGADNGAKFNAQSVPGNAVEDINDPYWDELVSQISVNEAIGAVIHGGSRSDTLTYVDNPIVIQNEGVNGFTTGAASEADENVTNKFNINSMTLLASSFNPQLAYEWGLIEGNSGLIIGRYHLWGIGLTQRRTPYNGRNYEYVSEDSMLANRIGYGVLKGCAEKGILNGPKHMGANDQEHNRAGVSAYMTEQKLREGDLRCFQGGLDEGGGLAVMIAFNRLGPTNAAHSVGMIKNILRGEWGFNYLVSTDMMNNKYYFNAESMIMATVTQVADFAPDNSFINQNNNHTAGDANWSYITVDVAKMDPELVVQARQNLKYQFFAYANSAILNVTTVRVTPWWEATLKGIIIGSAILTGISAVCWIVFGAALNKKEEK